MVLEIFTFVENELQDNVSGESVFADGLIDITLFIQCNKAISILCINSMPDVDLFTAAALDQIETGKLVTC